MLMKVSSFRHPLARHLAAWKMPLRASIRALLCPATPNGQEYSAAMILYGLQRFAYRLEQTDIAKPAIGSH